MKKSFAVLVLVFAAAAFAQQSAPPAPAAPAQQKKEIKNPAEYNAYITALNQQQPAQKAQALEAFLQQYPQSIVKLDALELLMATYQQVGDAAKVDQAAQQVLAADPSNLRALALLTYTNRMKGTADGMTAAGQYAQKGLQALQGATKPAEMADADWDKLKQQTGAIFNGAAGMAALQAKDYPNAAKGLTVAVEAAPTDLNNVYPLALAYLQQKPQDPRGLWFIARAANLAAGSPAQAQITNYGKRAFTVYHGGEDGWNELLQQTASTPMPPADWKVAPAPTPAEQAAKLVQDKPVSKMSWDEIQMVLTSGNQQASDTVWSGLKDKPIAIEGKVISATPTKLMIAGTYDDIQNSKPDIELTMAGTVPAKYVPKEGSMLQFEGNPATFEPNPFMVHMVEGKFVGQSAIPAAAEKPAPKRAPARRAPPKKPS